MYCFLNLMLDPWMGGCGKDSRGGWVEGRFGERLVS